ncbi:MAG: hypothetical protein PHY08_14385 [Candidatus Cloacimonetes bacterium]|nr:hypothetical protein [Candidatus Cloacimonadota bacterium]MDD4157747.1 hypothetical protein [Candidatus Cloacimonadota bacterium]
MDSVYLVISQNGRILKFFVIFLLILILYWFYKVRKRAYKTNISDGDIPAHLWFYSQLVDIEIGASRASSSNLKKKFIKFLYRKYKFTSYEVRKSTIFEVVRLKEANNEVLGLYGEIWNNIEDLKHSNKKEVISYIKTIKKFFNKEDVSGWLNQRKQMKQNQRQCNDC